MATENTHICEDPPDKTAPTLTHIRVCAEVNREVCSGECVCLPQRTIVLLNVEEKEPTHTEGLGGLPSHGPPDANHPETGQEGPPHEHLAVMRVQGGGWGLPDCHQCSEPPLQVSNWEVAGPPVRRSYQRHHQAFQTLF